jgi:hypothetical protein
MALTDPSSARPPRGARAERWATTLSGLGIAVPAALLSLDGLRAGGLAPLLLTGGVALVIGAPAALAEWRSRGRPAAEEPSPAVRAGTAAIAEVAGLSLAACALQTLAQASPAGLAAALLVWPVGAWLARRTGRAGIPVLAALPGLAILAIGRSVAAPPWTLLEPHWTGWTTFAGPAAVGGVWLAGVGTGRWALGPARPPGANRSPFAAVGVGVAVALLLAVDRGARFEATLGAAPAFDGASGWMAALAAVSMAGALCWPAAARSLAASASDRRFSGWVRPAVGLLLTAALAGPGAHVVPWVTSAVLPALTLVGAGASGLASTGPDRTLGLLAAGVCAAAPGAGWPGMPEGLWDAMFVGGLVVVGFWFVATRSVLAREAT